jgi:SAM-dependent methyltransferase
VRYEGAMPPAAAHVYQSDFFDYIEEGSDRSAAIVVPLIHRLLGSTSVLDVGCGRGVWLSRWMAAGVGDVIGVDGDYVATARLAIPAERFVSRDLSHPFSLGRRFDLVQSLEVAEHIAERHADTFIANLAGHGDVVLFSAAVPGQGGEMHVNEQPYDYWRGKFAAHGFRLFDWLRPRLSGLADVEPWYRYNAFVFAHDRVFGELPRELQETEVSSGQPLPDLAPLTWRLRNRVLRLLPQEAVHRLAGLKHKLILMRRQAAHR